MSAASVRDPALFPLHPLRDHALLAGGERAELVGPDGAVPWLCVPDWRSDAVFSSLSGGGVYAVTPRADRFT